MENTHFDSISVRRRALSIAIPIITGLLLSILFLTWPNVISPGLAKSGTRYVHTSLGSDVPSCGSLTSPCKTISYTVNNRAASGDSLMIAAGIYTENLTINSLDLTIRGGYIISDSLWISSTRPTIIDGNHLDRTLVLHNGTFLVEDITITSGQTQGGSCWCGGVWISNSNATIRRVHLTGNQAGCSGGALEVNNDLGPAALILEDSIVDGNQSGGQGGALTAWYASVTLSNVLIINNSASNTGSAINSQDSQVTIMNCTIADNQGGAVIRGVNNGGAVEPLIVTNSIIWNNQDVGFECDEGVCSARYSTLQDGPQDPSNLYVDPLFISSGNYHLQLGSPPVGLGTSVGAPLSDLDGVTRGNPPTMGTYELVNSAWRYPGNNSNNTHASTRDRWTLLDSPIELWNVRDREGWNQWQSLSDRG